MEIYMNYWFACISIYIFNIHYRKHCFYRTLVLILSGIERIICHTFFLLRLKVSFDGTNYAISNPFLFVLWIDISYVTFFTVGCILFYNHTGFLCGRSRGYKSGLMVIGIGAFNDVLCSMCICYMFIWRLRHMYGIQKHWKIVNLIHKLTLLS